VLYWGWDHAHVVHLFYQHVDRDDFVPFRMLVNLVGHSVVGHDFIQSKMHHVSTLEVLHQYKTVMYLGSHNDDFSSPLVLADDCNITSLTTRET
jgi:hypothetical protein